MTDKQAAQAFFAGIIANQAAWLFLVYMLKRDNKFLLEKQEELWDVIDWALETADTSDERLQKWATDIEFDIMSEGSLKSLKRKGWWRRG